MRIKIEIRLGNDAMQTPDEVAEALRRIAYRIDGANGFKHGEEVSVLDGNGNTVGFLKVSR